MRLIDCFMDLVVYVELAVKSGEEAQPSFETLKNNIEQLLEKSKELQQKGNFSDRDYNYARLSLCVWIDEAILNSNWEHKRQWQRHSLQRRYYNMADGGMEFFDRLDKIGHEDRDVREVAYFCLSLGLSGRYVEKGDNVVLDHLKTSNLKRLFGSSAGEPSLENRQLFPEAYQKQTESHKPQRRSISFRALPLIIGLSSVALFFGLMAIYYFMLNENVKEFIL